MAIPTDDDRELLTIVATFRAKPGKEAALRELLTSIIAPTLDEAGCIDYALHQGVADPAVFVFYENWTSQAHLDAHLTAPHINEGLAGLRDLLAEELVITPLRRVA